MDSLMTNPMGEYLVKIQLIIANSEFKNKELADKYETFEMHQAANLYLAAIKGNSGFSINDIEQRTLFDLLLKRGFSDDDAMKYSLNPVMLPSDIKNLLADDERFDIITRYEEKNKYYINLTGKPFMGDSVTEPDKVMLIPESFYSRYYTSGDIQIDQPVHTMSVKMQDLFMASDEYKQMLIENPQLDYIRHLGSSAIPIDVARKARDGDIMQINVEKLHTYHPKFGNVSVEPSVIHAFSNIYRATRDYVYQTLRGDFNNIYANYNSFIRYLTIYMAIGSAVNEFQKNSAKQLYFDKTTANNMFNLYGFPSIIMEEPYLDEFLQKFRLLLMDKGTNVVYRVKDIIGYEYTDIYTLVMVKQQVFENGYPKFIYNEDGTKTPITNIVFRRLGVTDENTSYFKFKQQTKEYSLEDIASGDPRWWNWNGKEMDKILHDLNYTLSNSKYIQLSTHMSLQDIWWEAVILLRGLLDKKDETKHTLINISKDIDGTSTLSVFEAVLSLIVVMHWLMKTINGNYPAGNLYYPITTSRCVDMLFNGMTGLNPNPLKEGNPFKVASFNFDVKNTNPNEYAKINAYDYLEPDIFIPMVENVLERKNSNIGETLLVDVKKIYKYLLNKIRDSRTIIDFRQCEDVYNLLFLVDPVRDWNEDVYRPDDIICDKYGITIGQYAQFKVFWSPNSEPEISFTFDNKNYSINIYTVLNENMFTYQFDETSDEYPFRNPRFVTAFNNAVKNINTSIDAMVRTSSLANAIKENYKNIIIDKVQLDADGNTIYGPTTFETLLLAENHKLYDALVNQKNNDPVGLNTTLRNIINALAGYCNKSLSALKYKALGEQEYIKELKDVISYFKSYMVEFTKEEFVLVFGGILDNGGHGDMLKLIDEIPHVTIEVGVVESLSLFDVSTAKMIGMMADGNNGEPILRDHVLFRLKAAYKDILDSGYEVWYDDGKRITKTPIDIDRDTECIANFVKSNLGTYKVIINIDNLDVIPPNYIGTLR